MIQWFREWWDGRNLGAARSSGWRAVQRRMVALYRMCRACGKRGTTFEPLEVHHILPFNLHPELELKESNLVVLCRRCHLLIGHLGSFKSYNVDVKEDADWLYKKITERP